MVRETKFARKQATKLNACAVRPHTPKSPKIFNMTKFCRSRADVLKAKKKQLIAYHEPVNLALASLKEGIKVGLAT